ncbi:hypothetical protein Bca52824_059413 [Brassica carinata]|uniref:PUM-HD domain-containing protein n=1 Tax=Brassica carinata TaxID=52824 RepID=A0A8X7QZM1_BRACI|nr:hypothetical protein Bca52824_059413 [Brassica carinata]
MDSSGINNTNSESHEEQNPTPVNQLGATQLQPSQPQPNYSRRFLDERLSRFPSGADLQTLESSFGSLSVADSSVPPFLENRWTNGSSSSSSSLQYQEINGAPGYNAYAGGSDSIYRNPNGGVFRNGNSQDVPPLSRGRHWGSNNGLGYVRNNSSWKSNQGFLNNHDQSLYFGNPRTRSIASLAKDQSSSAELQRKISEGSKETIDVVFEGVIFHVCDLMVDPYGHHVLRKLMERCSSEQISQIVDVITQQQFGFVKICTDPVGALAVKSLLRCLQTEEQILRIVRVVSLGALLLTRSSNAFVILQCFKQFHPSHTRELLAVIAHNCLQIATDEYGCRMLQQCLETGCNVVKQRLIQEIIANALRICADSYGNYVVQYLLELGDPNVTVSLIKQLLGNYAFLARNKFASHVVQKFLKIEYIDPSLIVYDLLKDIDTLLLDPFGNYVIQTAWFVCKDELRMILMMHIDRNKRLMRCNMYGNKILERLNL